MEVRYEIIEVQGEGPPRKRACINCGHRHSSDPDYCQYDWHYIGYMNEWDEWCRHWCKTREQAYAVITTTNKKRQKKEKRLKL